MTPDELFRICNLTAAAGWIVLIFLGTRRWAADLVTGFVLPGILAVLYTALVATHWGETPGGFGTLAGVASLFTNRWMLLAGWVHYLAFDLFIGSWEVRDARQNGVPHLLVVPSLGLTFFFGPAGLLLYLATRAPSRLRRPAAVTSS